MTLTPSNMKKASGPAVEPFLLDPGNYDFVQGKVRNIAYYKRTRRQLIFFIIVVVILLMGYGCFLTFLNQYGPQSSVDSVNVLILIFAAGAAGAFMFTIAKLRYISRLSQEGKVIQGKLTRNSREKVRGRYGFVGYKFTVWYSFSSPLGDYIEGKFLISKPYDFLVPQIGTPVNVLYLDDKHYQML